MRKKVNSLGEFLSSDVTPSVVRDHAHITTCTSSPWDEIEVMKLSGTSMNDESMYNCCRL